MLIIHGDDNLKSREYLNNLLSKKSQVYRYEAKNLDITSLTQELNNIDLFGQTPTIVIFNFFSSATSNKKQKLQDLFKTSQHPNLVLYEDSAINKNSLKAYTSAKIEEFVPPKIIFEFTDSLLPRNAKCLELYQLLIDKGESAEYLFVMIVRQFRLMIQATGNAFFLPPWQRNKLIKQARAFGENKLPKIHENLYKIEKGIKSGSLTTSLEINLFNFLAQL